MKIAISQYAIELLADWQACTVKMESLVRDAKNKGAECLLLPEYAGIEMACQHYETDAALYAALQPLVPTYLDFYKTLARRYQMYIQPGTVMVQVESGLYANRAYFFGPDGAFGYQDKIKLVEFEKANQLFQGGQQQILFNTAFGLIGIAICYDSEFPELVRRLTDAGAWLVLVPSYTTSMAGYYRVSLSCRARAVENQCYVAMASMVGMVELSGEKEQVFGQSAVFSPADDGFADDGVVAKAGTHDKLILADLDPNKLTFVRAHGQVRNFTDAKIALTGGVVELEL